MCCLCRLTRSFCRCERALKTKTKSDSMHLIQRSGLEREDTSAPELIYVSKFLFFIFLKESPFFCVWRFHPLPTCACRVCNMRFVVCAICVSMFRNKTNAARDTRPTRRQCAPPLQICSRIEDQRPATMPDALNFDNSCTSGEGETHPANKKASTQVPLCCEFAPRAH